VTPAIDPIDIAISSVVNVFQLRDIVLARAESEVGREIVLRLPVAERNVSDFRTEAVEGEGIPPIAQISVDLSRLTCDVASDVYGSEAV